MVEDPAASLPDPFSSSLTGRRLGRYEVLARLASGGMAGVYVARALGVAGFERLFAIKVLHPHLAHEEEFVKMFLDEARLAARIHHPNVVATIDISDTRGAGYYLVMDYIEGDHLGALLQRAFKLGTRLPAPVSLRMVVDALNGLAAAHSLRDETGQQINLVHRDVSPHNVMVSTDGISRLSDFGVAKAEVRLSTTQEGQFKGKLAYMAPEHASNGEADQRSDLFSMSIILWECLTGTRLFRAENHAATLNKVCLEPIPLPSSVDPELAVFDPILAKGLARDPAERFQSAEEFAETIEAYAHELGGLATHRVVGQLAREYSAEKLVREAELIRTAIADLSAAPPVEEPYDEPPTETNLEAARASGPVPAPSSSPAGRPRALWVGAFVVAIVGLALWLFSNRSTDTVEIAPLPRSQATPAPTPVETAPAPVAAPQPAEAPPTMQDPADRGVDDPTIVPPTPGAAETDVEPQAEGEEPDHGERATTLADPEAQDDDKPRKRKKKRGPDDLILNPYR